MKPFFRIIILLAILVMAYFVYQSRQASRLNTEGVRLFDRGEYEDAVKLLEKAHASSPDSKMVLKNLALTYHELGEYEKSRDLFEELLAKEPSDEDIRAQYEAVKTKVELSERASKRVERMKMEGWQDDYAPLETTLRSAEASFQVGNYEHAIILYERALFKEPDNIDIEFKIEQIEEQLKERNF